MYLDWNTSEISVYVIDIEADSLTPTVIHCLCWRNLATGEIGEEITTEGIRAFFDATAGSYYIGHNILKFDAPVLSRICGSPLSVANCMDTLVLSQLYSPSLSGGHSLDAWGQRLNKPKIKYNDWSRLTSEMIEYCHQDVLITAELFRRLIKTLNRIGFSEKSIWIQHRFTVILDRQQRNGFSFDGRRALAFYQMLRAREAELGDQIHAAFPPTLEVQGTYKRCYRKDGSFSAQYLRHSLEYEKIELFTGDDDSESYRVFGRTPFNIGSPKQRVEKLVELGWVPQETTPTGQPKPFEKNDLVPSLKKFLEDKDVPEVLLIAKWMSINGRGNMVNTWLDNWNEDTGCIHGKLFIADTLRLRHQAPNTANIPAVRVGKDGNVILGEDGYYTYEARDLWTCRRDRVLVGTDAAGLELRMLAHFLNRPEFTEQVVFGDPHQYNADLVGITRPQAKTLIYAVLYGAAAPKVSKTLGVTVKEAAYIRNMFLEKLGVGKLIQECQYEQSKGRVSLVDGSQVVCPSPHAALNYKLQGSGARVMALGSILLENDIRRLNLDSLKVGDIHDEWQYDVDPDDANIHAQRSVEAIRQAGRKLELLVPLDATSKIGKTWAETH